MPLYRWIGRIKREEEIVIEKHFSADNDESARAKACAFYQELEEKFPGIEGKETQLWKYLAYP